MTAGSLIQKAWEELGEPSDINPATVGVPKLLSALNDAQDVVAQWIDDRGRKVYFRELEDEVQFTTVVLTGTLDTEAVGRAITMPNSIPLVVGHFQNWILKVGSESRTVLASLVLDGRVTLTVSQAFSSDVLGLDYVLAKRDYQLVGVDAIDTGDVRVSEIVRVFDMEDGALLDKAASREFMTNASTGVPGAWRNSNRGLLFDAAPETERTYVMQVVKLPLKIEAQTDEIQLPDAFTQAVLSRLVWWGWKRAQDFQAAFSAKKDFNELMTRLATAIWLSNEPDYFTVRNR